MKKLLRTSLCMMALLSLEQAHAKSKETKETATQEAANKDSWAYRNRYKIAGGAALGAGAAAAYLYQNEIADFIKSLSPQQAAQQVAALEGSIAADLKDVTKKEAMVDAKEHKSEESVADMQADIAQKQDAIAKKQTMLESFYEYLTSKERLQEINPENKPVDSWGFYKSTPNSKLTPEEEAEWQKQNAHDKSETDREKSNPGLINLLLTAANPLLSNTQKAETFEKSAAHYENLMNQVHVEKKPVKKLSKSPTKEEMDETIDAKMYNITPKENLYKNIATTARDAGKEYRRNAS